MEILKKLSETIIRGDYKGAEEYTKAALEQGLTPKEVLNDGLLSGMGVIGKRFKANEIFIPEVLIAARAMKAAMEILKPLLVETGVKPVAKVVLGTVKGDLHDIGKNLVGMMLQGGGFEVIDIGVDVKPEVFVEKAKETHAEIVGLSALLTTTMSSMPEVIRAFEEDGLRDRIKIMIGGAPITEAYAREIGADGYAPDAASAVELAQTFMGGRL